MTVSIVQTMKAGRVFSPVTGTLPSGIVSTDAFNAAAQTFTNPTTILWNSGSFNIQGQQWEAMNAGDATQGCRNAATPRTSGGIHYNHITEFEFLFTGTGFDIAFIGNAYYDCQVYIESGATMYKAQTVPLTGTTSGLMYRRIVFAATFHGRIRVHLGGGAFIGIGCEQSAIIKKSPDRLFGICDGGSWSDGAGTRQTSGTSYLTANLCDFLFERTGIVWARRSQSGTGFFTNSAATVATDIAAVDNSTRWFSQSRKDWSVNAGDFANKPLFYLIVDSLADGGISGATGSLTGTMATREKACLQWIRSQDSYCTIVHVSPSPFTGAGAAGTITGPPTAGSGHDLNRQEQIAAIASVPRAAYINSFGPSTPWFSGTGSNGSPATSQQAALVGVDGTNLNYLGYTFYGGKIAEGLAQVSVNSARARRQV